MAPYKEKEIEKKYFTISEVAEMFDVTTSLIRFWETEFSILKPLQKEKNAKRKFKIREIEIILKIKTLLYLEKFTIKGANEQLKNWKPVMSFQEMSDYLENGVIPVSEIKMPAELEKRYEHSRLQIADNSNNNRNVLSNRHLESLKLVAEIRNLLTKIK